MNSLQPSSPVSWAPSEFWDGDDGSWSSFALRVGTPEQDVRVLPSTAGQATWVIIPEGCLGTSTSNCAQSRGGIFDYNSSSTWVRKGDYTLGLEANLGYNQSESALYGLDTVALGFSNATNIPSLDQHLIAGLATYDYPIGMFGLGQQPSNLSIYDNGYPSFLTTMKSKGLIPSESWGYTAGAPYRLTGVFGSLTFGGYDLSRFVPSNVSFPFTPDISRDLVVGLQSITSTSTNPDGTTSSLLPSPAYAFIDSTVPWIYLPIQACQTFENELGLVFDSDAGLYLVSDELHKNLTSRELSFTFQLGALTTGGPTVAISLPYASFDLMAKPPFVSNSSRYFPILRAQNASQITLGRVFLQEAYLITNYEHSNFSVSQCAFEDGVQKNIITIPPASSPNSTNITSNNPPNGLQSHKSSQTINTTTIGIIIGIVVFVVFSLLAFACAKRKRLFARGDRKMSEISEADGSPASLKHSPIYEIDYNSLAHFKEMEDTGLAELPQSNRSFAQNTMAHSTTTVGKNSTVVASSLDSPSSRTLVTDLSSDTVNSSWTNHHNRVRDPPHPHPRFCAEFVSSPVSVSIIPRTPLPLPDLHRPLPPLPTPVVERESVRVSQISQLIDVFMRQEKWAFRVMGKPVPRQEDWLGNFF